MLTGKGKFLSTTVMRAVVVSQFGAPEVLEVQRNVPIPVAGPNEVLIKVAAIGVNPVDTYIRSGKYARLPKLPYVPGSDVSGTIVAMGENVKDFSEGDKVASFMNVKTGGYAEYCVVQPDWLVRLPENCNLRKGAAVGTPYFTAYKALFLKAQAKASDTVLVHGASGGVGIAAVQLASSRGLKVLGTAGSREGMRAVLEQGAAAVFDHKDEGYMEKIKSATGGKGPDVILEMLANVNLSRDLELLAPNGKVMIIGCRGSIEINPRATMGKETCIQGVGLFATTKSEFSEMRAAIQAGLKCGWIDPIIGSEYSLNSVVQSHKDIIFNTGTKGKMILIV